jgi:sarcosine oxidase delta subunit
MQDQATIICPHCGEENTIGLDWGGSTRQQYEEDCQVCCRPWRVTVEFDGDGQARVRVEPLED